MMGGVTVGTRSLHGMIRFFMTRLQPKCVSSSFKRTPTLYSVRRNVHTGGADYDSEVENTPLLRIVRNRASEYSNLRSEVSHCQVGQTYASAECTALSSLEMVPQKMGLYVLNG